MSKLPFFKNNIQTISSSFYNVTVFLAIFTIIYFIIDLVPDGSESFLNSKINEIQLTIKVLPSYALQTFARMLTAITISLITTIIIGKLMVRYNFIEQVMIPTIDILQSIPPLSIMAIILISIINFFPNSRAGPEFAAIFTLFFSQIWNMLINFYQSLKTIPKELSEVCRIYKLSNWQTFWNVELPYSAPGLIWNMIVSMSAGWFIIVGSEAISVMDINLHLPGIGSYLHIAIAQENKQAVAYALIAMIIVIIIYDQLIFRPLLAMANKFQDHEQEYINYNSWFYNIIQKKSKLKNIIINLIKHSILSILYVISIPIKLTIQHIRKYNLKSSKKTYSIQWPVRYNDIMVNIIFLSSFIIFCSFISNNFSNQEIIKVAYLGLITTIKVMLLTLIASIIWVPIGIKIGLNAQLTKLLLPLIQFLAAIPPEIIYPLIHTLILKYHLNIEIYTAPIMILGTQWYILFNVIAGATTISKEQLWVADNFHIKGWLWWRRLALPAIFPYYITGAIAAAGGCWNACILADAVTWGNSTLYATGLGAYLNINQKLANTNNIYLGLGIMTLIVLFLNKIFWNKLLKLSQEKFGQI